MVVYEFEFVKQAIIASLFTENNSSEAVKELEKLICIFCLRKTKRSAMKQNTIDGLQSVMAAIFKNIFILVCPLSMEMKISAFIFRETAGTTSQNAVRLLTSCLRVRDMFTA